MVFTTFSSIAQQPVVVKVIHRPNTRPPLGSRFTKHYCRVVTAIAKTVEAQKEVDGLYAGVEKNFVESAGVDLG